MRRRWRAFADAWRDYPLRRGERIGTRYAVLKHIGTGSYGIAYRCRDRETERVVLVKQAKPSKGGVAVKLLERERDVLDRFSHPFIPALRDFFAAGDSHWLVTDYIEGLTLEELIFEKGMLYDERAVLEWTLKLMERVAYVHGCGYVHLDLRIPNVIVREEGLYLIDFGLARRIGDYPDRGNKGQPDLPDRMPPEVSSDLYDIGHLMLFMLYSSFEPDRQAAAVAGTAEPDWREELPLTPGMRSMLERLLGDGAPFVSAEDFISVLNAGLGTVRDKE